VAPAGREEILSELTALQAAGLGCVRGLRPVFRDLSFHVRAGEVLAVEGPNGSGKTSLLRMIAGFLTPAAGELRAIVAGKAQPDGEERAKLVGWLGHQDGAKPQMSPREVTRFYGALYNTNNDYDALLDAARLGRVADLPCQYLSAGQKRRLALVRLKVSARPLWLLDEPLAALDEDGRNLLRSMIAEHQANAGIVLAATHDSLGIECSHLCLEHAPQR
jgi:heme exporter protein A